ncbi:hypothetical protein SAMD00023353_2700820 [Rosellinia necatrix]|uniref:HNH nuclease domain-containing protein n=1 Tax=Rosellinia necatrix TaxID=77044 RepID=A0A1W2TGU1_ROSNE|nr:hypothetical protein SAMD00023353_2700820 [Rosellinia necatrix]
MRTKHVKPTLAPPCAIEYSNIHPIEFFHPAYPQSTPPLLALAAVDKTDDGMSGLDHETAKIACGIVAGNKWDDETYFATKDANTNKWVKVIPPSDGILPAGPAYYFIVETQHQYPVTPSFDHWRFPHDRLPELWSTLSIPDATGRISGDETDGCSSTRYRDRSCRITGSLENTEGAHLVPVACSEWFKDNRMGKYGRMFSVFNAIDDERNLLLLRSDIHGLFDKNRFAIIPKQIQDTGMDSPDCILMTHAILPKGSYEISHFYHNRALQPVMGIAREYLFARFAMSIFCDELCDFFGGPSQYKIRLYDRKTGEESIEDLYGKEVKTRSQIFPSAGNRLRSINPKRREMTPNGQGVALSTRSFSPRPWDEDESTSSDESQREDKTHDQTDNETNDETHCQAERGRKRMRSVDYYRGLTPEQGYQQGNISLLKRQRPE